MGGGFNFEPVETPFDFDKGALVHLDNHATFYSLKASQEYLNLVEKYKVYKASYIDSDIGEMAISFYQKYPYLLHVAFDVPFRLEFHLARPNHALLQERRQRLLCSSPVLLLPSSSL